MSLIGNFIRVEDDLWINLDLVTTVRDDSVDDFEKGKTFKIVIWSADNPQGVKFKGQDALNIMRMLGLPLCVSVDDQ